MYVSLGIELLLPAGLELGDGVGRGGALEAHAAAVDHGIVLAELGHRAAQIVKKHGDSSLIVPAG